MAKPERPTVQVFYGGDRARPSFDIVVELVIAPDISVQVHTKGSESDTVLTIRSGREFLSLREFDRPRLVLPPVKLPPLPPRTPRQEADAASIPPPDSPVGEARPAADIVDQVAEVEAHMAAMEAAWKALTPDIVEALKDLLARSEEPAADNPGTQEPTPSTVTLGAYLRSIWAGLWSAVRHPFKYTVIDISTGEAAHLGREDYFRWLQGKA